MKKSELALFRRSATKRTMPRRKLFKRGTNLNLHISRETVRRLDRLVRDGESRSDVLREAVEREIARREAEKGKDRP
jgi:Ribbon-helix-helix protein, copG family